MKQRTIFLLISIILQIISAGKILAQPDNYDLLQVKYLYNDLRFEEAIEAGQEILNRENLLEEKGQLAFLHQYLAFSFYQIGQSDSSRSHFISLIIIEPKKELDPLHTSPKIIDFFNQIKSDFESVNSEDIYIPYTRYIFIEDKRPSAAWRSAILPGWGQYYKGQHTRAYIFGSAFLANTLFLGVAIINENNYKDSYLSSSDPDEISGYYDKYNNWSKVRKISTVTIIGIWVLSFADALWSDYPKIEFNLSQRGYNSPSLSYSFAF